LKGKDMKKFALLLLIAGLVFGGCGGQQNLTPDQITDAAFVGMIIAKPELKPIVVKGIDKVLVVLEQDITYAELISEVSKVFGNKYAPLAGLIISYLNEDAPVSQELLTLFDSTRITLRTKLNHLKTFAMM